MSEPITARGYIPAPRTIPTAIAQKRYDYIKRIFDGGTESYDGERADHTERQNDI